LIHCAVCAWRFAAKTPRAIAISPASQLLLKILVQKFCSIDAFDAGDATSKAGKI
jgi:hypothetical protein